MQFIALFLACSYSFLTTVIIMHECILPLMHIIWLAFVVYQLPIHVIGLNINRIAIKWLYIFFPLEFLDTVVHWNSWPFHGNIYNVVAGYYLLLPMLIEIKGFHSLYFPKTFSILMNGVCLYALFLCTNNLLLVFLKGVSNEKIQCNKYAQTNVSEYQKWSFGVFSLCFSLSFNWW